jgi:hypothetical protein
LEAGKAGRQDNVGAGAAPMGETELISRSSCNPAIGRWSAAAISVDPMERAARLSVRHGSPLTPSLSSPPSEPPGTPRRLTEAMNRTSATVSGERREAGAFRFRHGQSALKPARCLRELALKIGGARAQPRRGSRVGRFPSRQRVNLGRRDHVPGMFPPENEGPRSLQTFDVPTAGSRARWSRDRAPHGSAVVMTGDRAASG